MSDGSILPAVRYSALGGRAAIGLAVLGGAAVGCGAMFSSGADFAPKALRAWIGNTSGSIALAGQFEHGAKASATKRLLVSESAASDLTENLRIFQFELAEAPQSKPSAEKLPNAPDAEYQSRLKNSQEALDAAVRAKELASQELEAERRRTQAIRTLLEEASRQLARLRADGSTLERRLKDSQGALDAAVRAKELASQELEAERHRAQAIQEQLEEASQQLARLRADGGKFEVEARRLRDAMAQLGDALPGSTQAGETGGSQRATAQTTEQMLRERLRASQRESQELELRARMAILEMDKEAAKLRAEQAAEAARRVLAADREDQSRPGDAPRVVEPGTAGDVARTPPRQATVASKAPPEAKVGERSPGAAPRVAEIRPLPQHRLTQRRKWISVAVIKKARTERQRRAVEAAAAARKAEEERLRVAAEAAEKAEAERQRLVAAAAEAARIAKEAAEAKARADQEIRRRTLGLTVTLEDGARYLARGRALLTSGDVASARLFLERASNAGLAEAAMELAETYDPATVARLSAVGLVGDREQAKAWYMRAQTLGSFEATERLKSIVGQ